MTFAMIVHLELRARLRRWRFYATLGLLIAILAAATRLTAASYQPPSLREYEGRPELAMMQQHFADLEPQRLADRDRAVFAVFVHLQGLAVLLIAPLFAATAIATERERHTLEPLLLTDLRNGEIILGRWLVRLILLGLLLLAGLPVLFASGFVVGRAGGVPAGTFWAATAMVAALSIFALGIGVLASTVSRRHRRGRLHRVRRHRDPRGRAAGDRDGPPRRILRVWSAGWPRERCSSGRESSRSRRPGSCAG